MDKKIRNQMHYAWVILLAVSLIRGVAGPGINGSSGVFLSPVSAELGVGVGQLSLYLSVSSIATLLWLPMAGKLFHKYGVKTMVLAGALLQAGAFTMLGVMNNVWAWYLLSIPWAMGAVLLVNLLGPVLINRWFSKNVGLVMGIMMTITSLLGAVFQPVMASLIDTRGWRFTYGGFGVFALVFLLVVGFSLLRGWPKEKHLLPYGETEEVTDLAGNSSVVQATTSRKTEGIAQKDAVKMPAFYTLMLFMIVLTGFATFQQHITTFGLGLGFPLTFIGKALSISMIGSAIGSLLIGFFSDWVGVVPTSVAVLGIGFIAVALFAFGSELAALFALATFLHGLAASSIGVVAPLLTTKFFGFKDYETLFSLVMLGAPLASIVLMPAYGFLYDRFGNYNVVLGFLLIALVVAGIGLVTGYKNSKNR